MIVGHGDIAQALKEAAVDRPFITFFASGVSNSKTEDVKEFHREIELLYEQPKDQHIVYFSSLCIYYSQSRYALHKLKMEHEIKALFPNHTIVRLGNITWGKNKNTIINHFKWEHHNGRTPELQDTCRFLIDAHEFIHWMKLIPVGIRNQMNITGQMLHVNEIWRRVCNGEY